MRWLWCGVALLAACASSAKVERAAVKHEERAAALQAEGYYSAAAREREAAAKQRDKAARRAQAEATSPVLPPLLR